MTRIVRAIVCIAVLFFSAAGMTAAQPSRNHKSSQGANSFIDEMILIDSVMREVVSAVAVGEGARVTKTLQPMLKAAENTEEAFRSGAIKLSKNGDRAEDFLRRDAAFHSTIQALDRAGRRNDREAMLEITKQLLQGCVSCHMTFRE